MRLIVFLAIAVIGLSGCDQFKDKYNTGYSDGYAVGYNTTCQIRATLIEGDWDNQSYKQGYDRGYIDGAATCRASK